MEYIVGIDGGGTKTKLTLCDKEGNILHTVTSGPSNILSSGYEVAKKSITEVINEGILESGYELEQCASLCIGVAGAGREHIKRQLEEIIRSTGYKGKLVITHDAETALVGGTEGKEGILIIAGTGTICYGKTKEGKIHRLSGWGHIIGDEGSAYSIGIKILNAVMKAYDGRGEETALTNLLLEHMGIHSEDEIITSIYSPKVTKEHIAALASLIDKGCKLHDKVALEIVDETVEDLYICVDAMIKALESTSRSVKIIIHGSVLVKNTYINKGFKEKLKETYPLAGVYPMAYDAAYGAVLIAKQNLLGVYI